MTTYTLTQILTLDQAKAQLRIDGTDDDVWLTPCIAAVTRAIVQWCGGDEASLQAVDGTIHPNVQLAALVEVAYQFANREGPPFAYVQQWFEKGYPLSAGAVALLQPLHKPISA